MKKFNFYDDVWEPIFGDGTEIGKVLLGLFLLPFVVAFCVVIFLAVSAIFTPFFAAPTTMGSIGWFWVFFVRRKERD